MTGSLAREPRRNPLTGSAFIRSLAALNDVQALASPDDFAQRISQWLDWTHAFALSAALNDAPPPHAESGSPRPADAHEREHARVRDALTRLVADTLAADPAPEFLVYRRRYVACQQAMESQIGPLRRRVRATLTSRSSAMAKLAALDSVMEPVVGAQERALLSTVASLLEPRFERLRRAHPATPLDQPGMADVPLQRTAWLDLFHQDMRALLLAELDLRLQPVEGLLAACRSSSSECP